nr:keratin-associated protein 19-4-like [Procambarus clarkii]
MKVMILSMSVALLVACSFAEPDASSYSTYPYAGGSYGLSSPGIGRGFRSFGGGTRYGSFGGVGGGYGFGSGPTSHSIFNLGAPQGRYGGNFGRSFDRGYIGGSSGLGFGGNFQG